MPAVSTPADSIPDEQLEPYFYSVTSADGTTLRAWTNDPDHQIDGPTVVLCNGLGTNAWALPALLAPDCGVRVISWNHRGTGGSDRPADRNRVGVDEFVEDAIAVMDDAGLDRAPFMGWSIGVNTMFELAHRHPERVESLFAVAGVPGNTFSTMLGPLRLPLPMARLATVNAARAMKLIGPALSPIARRLPMGPTSVKVLSHSGFMLPVADAGNAGRAVREFLSTPLGWYFHLALKAAQHRRVPLSDITAPTLFVAGRYDLLAGTREIAGASRRIEGARLVELPGSHFVAMEQPERVHALLLESLASIEE